MSNRFTIYPELNLGVSKLEPGSKSFEEVYSLAEEFRKSEKFPTVHYQVADMRGCTFQFGIGKIKEMMELVKKYDHIDNQKIGVYMVDKPLVTAMVHIFFNIMGRRRHYCSTTEKAYSLLNLPLKYEQFLALIDI